MNYANLQDTVLGDVKPVRNIQSSVPYLFTDGTISKFIGNKTPIAVQVGQASDYPDGKLRFMSLKVMSKQSDKGTTDDEGMDWGPWGTPECDTPLQNCDQQQALADFDGKNNTEVLKQFEIANVPVYTDGSTGITRPRAALACAQFSPGIYNGEWYLPAFGELNVVRQNISAIENAIDIAEYVVNGSTCSLNMQNHNYYKRVWSSTECDAGNVWCNSFVGVNNDVSKAAKDPNVRAFVKIDPYGSHDYVEINGLKWATVNIGANDPTEDGYFFQWGDTTPYTKTSKLQNNKYNPSGDQETYTKYVEANEHELDNMDDAAVVHWGHGWRMPTVKEFDNLLKKDTYEYVTNYNNTGVDGILVGGKLFFADTHTYLDHDLISDEDEVVNATFSFWWTSNNNMGSSKHANTMSIFNGAGGLIVGTNYGMERCMCFPIRPVHD